MPVKKVRKEQESAGPEEPETPEPAAPPARFVVQEHHASHLHWDFRLEMDGVLKSWAVPKGPPTETGIRRLAVAVADHSVDYIDFEGTIEEGQYGAGSVAIWDRGTFVLRQRDKKQIKIHLAGKKLKGDYVLVHMKDKNWLLIKEKHSHP